MYFLLSSLGSKETDKIGQSHVADNVATDDKFCDELIYIFKALWV